MKMRPEHDFLKELFSVDHKPGFASTKRLEELYSNRTKEIAEKVTTYSKENSFWLPVAEQLSKYPDPIGLSVASKILKSMFSEKGIGQKHYEKINDIINAVDNCYSVAILAHYNAHLKNGGEPVNIDFQL